MCAHRSHVGHCVRGHLCRSLCPDSRVSSEGQSVGVTGRYIRSQVLVFIAEGSQSVKLWVQPRRDNWAPENKIVTDCPPPQQQRLLQEHNKHYIQTQFLNTITEFMRKFKNKEKRRTLSGFSGIPATPNLIKLLAN